MMHTRGLFIACLTVILGGLAYFIAIGVMHR